MENKIEKQQFPQLQKNFFHVVTTNEDLGFTTMNLLEYSKSSIITHYNSPKITESLL